MNSDSLGQGLQEDKDLSGFYCCRECPNGRCPDCPALVAEEAWPKELKGQNPWVP
jgi:hypothetical protein